MVSEFGSWVLCDLYMHRVSFRSSGGVDGGRSVNFQSPTGVTFWDCCDFCHNFSPIRSSETVLRHNLPIIAPELPIHSRSLNSSIKPKLSKPIANPKQKLLIVPFHPLSTQSLPIRSSKTMSRHKLPIIIPDPLVPTRSLSSSTKPRFLNQTLYIDQNIFPSDLLLIPFLPPPPPENGLITLPGGGVQEALEFLSNT